MDNAERDLLIQVATRYYLKNETQSSIAKSLFISRPTVSRLLKKARDLRIVTINVNYKSDDTIALANYTKYHYNVKNVIITPTIADQDLNFIEIGKAASHVVYDMIHDGANVGVSFGRSVLQAINQTPEKSVEDVDIVEIFGAISSESEQFNTKHIGSILAEKMHGRFHPISAPLYVDSEALRKSLMQNPVVGTTLKRLDSLDFLLTGIGAMNTFKLHNIWDGYLGTDLQNNLTDAGCVGFMCAHFFNKDGEFIDMDINKRIIGIEEEQIKKTKVVCVAGGTYKAEAIEAALKAGLIHTLVIDEDSLKLAISYRGETNEKD